MKGKLMDENVGSNIEPDTGDDTDFELDDTEPTVEIGDDSEYTLESVPSEPGGYTVDEKITQLGDFDSGLLDSFRQAAHSEGLTQSRFEKIIGWWNKDGIKFRESGFGDDFKKAFTAFAVKNRFTEGTVTALETWFDKYIVKTRKQVAQIKGFSKKSGNRSNDIKAAEIAKIRRSKAYLNKGTTSAERKAHKAAVQKMIQLCSGENR